MGWFRKKANKDKLGEYHNIGSLDDLFQHLIEREHWKEISPNIIRQIFKNSQNDVFNRPSESIELLKLFIFISEQYNLVKGDYTRIAKDAAANLGDVLGSFSLTLYWLGSRLGKACCLAKTQEELEGLGVTADMAFTASILCDPFNLSSYYGMVVLHGGTFKHKNAGLEFCAKYRQMEDKLLSTPDNQLTPLQLAGKQNLNRSPEEHQKDLKRMEKLAPGLFPRGALFDEMSLRDRINALEKELLQL